MYGALTIYVCIYTEILRCGPERERFAKNLAEIGA